MAAILIDSNRFLAFYDTDSLSRVLPLLETVQDHVFIPGQVVSEVRRNRVNVFGRTLSDRIRMPKWLIADHLLPDDDQATDFRAEVLQHQQQAEALHRKVTTVFGDALSAVADGTDHVTTALERLFESGVAPSEEQLERARMRRECGRPPGKRTDPLGDQLAWEQFLDASREEAALWIISSDDDYFVSAGSTIRLNPDLMSDLLRGDSTYPDVHCFKSLSQGLDHFAKIRGPFAHTLNEADTRDVADEERKTATKPEPYYPLQYPISKPNICPSCDKRDSFNGGSYLRSRYGGLTLQFICTGCGFHYDTGDSWD